MMDIELPRADEAERSVLGGVLMNNRALFDVAGVLRTEHFHVDLHRRVWTAIEALARKNQPIDAISVHASIASADVPMVRVMDLMEGVPRSMNVGYYATLVINAAKLRAVVLAAKDAAVAATSPGAQAVDVIEQAQAAYFALSSDESTKKVVWTADEMTAELASMLEGDAPVTSVPPVSVGLPSIDALFDGFGGGDLAFLAGRPSTGKTALAGQIALEAAQDRTVLCCALEMKHSAIWRRMLAHVSRAYLPSRRKLTEHEKTIFGRGLAKLSTLKMNIADVPSATDMQILATARRIQMQQGLGLIVVDYLQLMRADGKFRSRGDELGVITRSLKQIAMQLDVPILVLAALSRDAASGRPNMSHIRECGTAEYDADHIFLMHRDVDEQKDLEEGQPSKAELIVEKQRNGATGSVSLLYYGDTYRFESQAVA